MRELGGQMAGCRPSEFGMAPWFWQALTPESGGVLAPWVTGHGMGCRPMEVAMAL
jgi:hypothetical protein